MGRGQIIQLHVIGFPPYALPLKVFGQLFVKKAVHDQGIGSLARSPSEPNLSYVYGNLADRVTWLAWIGHNETFLPFMKMIRGAPATA